MASNRENFGSDFARTSNLLADINGADVKDEKFNEVVTEGLLSKVDGPYPPEGHGYSRRAN